jgi:hypothetical protein
MYVTFRGFVYVANSTLYLMEEADVCSEAENVTDRNVR